jgi:O-antigen/teichoic acid export membrane protein
MTGTESDQVLIRGASASLSMRVGSVVFAYLVNLLLARWLGVTGYGQYVYALGFAVPIAVAGAVGTDRVALRYLPAYIASSELTKIRGFFGWSRKVVIRSSLSVAAFIAVAAVLAGEWITAELRSAILLGCALGPLLALTRLNSSMLLAFKRVVPATLHELLRPILLALFAGVALAVFGVVSVQIAILALGLSLTCIIMMQTMMIRQSGPRGPLAAAKESESTLWISTIRAMFVIQVLQIVMSKLDIILLGSMIDMESVAVFGVAKRIAVLAGFSEVAVAMIAQPVITELHAAGKLNDVSRVVRIAVHISLWPTIVVALSIAFFSDAVLGMFGAEFIVGSRTLWILLGAQLLHAMVSPAFILLTFTGYHNVSARMTGLVFVLNGIFVPAGITFAGMVGAAWASIATALVWNVLMHTWVWKTLGISTVPFLRDRSAKSE